MDFVVGDIVDGKFVETEVYTKPQSEMTSDCFLVQFQGLRACESCSARGTADCGGGETLKALKPE